MRKYCFGKDQNVREFSHKYANTRAIYGIGYINEKTSEKAVQLLYGYCYNDLDWVVEALNERYKEHISGNRMGLASYKISENSVKTDWKKYLIEIAD
jgi:hypothetical protein